MVFAGAGGASAETLADALVKAYQTSPLLESNRAALRAQDETVPQARADRRPQVSASATADLQNSSRDNFDSQIDTYSASLNASLLVYDSGQTRAAIESARQTVASGRASLLDIEQTVLFNAVDAYTAVVQALEFLRIAESDVRVLDENLRAANNRFEVGEVTRTDVSLTQAALEQSRAQLSTAQGDLQTARQSYLAAVGVLPVDLDPMPPIPALPGSIREAEALAVRLNPTITAAQFAERAAVADFDRALAAKGPQVSVNAGIGYQGQESLGIEGSDDTVGQLGLSAELPLYTGGRNDSLVRQAQAILDQRRFEVQDTARAVVEQVNAAWIQYDVARATEVANRRQLEAARTAYEGVREEARLGARSTLDVLDADQDRLEAEAEIVRSQRNEYVAAYGLLQAMGLLTVDHLNLGIGTYDPDLNYMRVQSGPVGGYDTSAVDRIRARWHQN